MSDIDDDWENFNNGDLSKECNFETDNYKTDDKHKKDDDFIPKCGEIYISTQTKIAHLNQSINLNDINLLMLPWYPMQQQETRLTVNN